MYDVEELFKGRSNKTRIWLSARASKSLLAFTRKHEKDKGRFLKQIERYAEIGFAPFTGKTKDIRPEWDGVYRIGCRYALFRLIGFYEDPHNFIVIDALEKSGQKLSGSDRSRINAVAAVCREQSYRKINHGDYPRLA